MLLYLIKESYNVIYTINKYIKLLYMCRFSIYYYTSDCMHGMEKVAAGDV